MARPSVALVQALRTTARRLESAAVIYRWSSFAHCNCGHLAQTVTGLTAREIQEGAMQREGDWGEQAAAHPARGWNVPRPHPRPDYGARLALDEGAWEPENVGACSATGTPLDAVLDRLYELGLTPDDVRNLERLGDSVVRRRLGTNTEHFAHHERDNVVKYLRAWADLLEEELDEGTALLAAQ
jgi:hypothetical protein